MSEYKVIFTDIDGTLLNSNHRISEKTLKALKAWTDAGKHLVLTSSRGVSRIMPIIKRYDLNCSMIALGGALVLDSNQRIISENGMTSDTVKRIIAHAEAEQFPACWNVYTATQWVTKRLEDPRVRNEADIVEAEPTGTDLSTLDGTEKIGKILFICDPGTIDGIEASLKHAFPELAIARSSDILLEVNPPGITKGDAVHVFCAHNQIKQEETIAFGDNYNDLSMLQAVARPIIMGNAPQEIRNMFQEVTADNDHDGVAAGTVLLA